MCFFYENKLNLSFKNLLMKNAVLITIGNEVLSGTTIDTNSNFIAKELSDIGISVSQIFTISDEVESIKQSLKSAFERADMVITTGGLGPTCDDLTKQTLARAIGEHPPQAALLAALRFLAQNPPDAPAGAALAELWQWAQAHWSIAAVPRRRQAVADSFFQGNLMHPNDISAQPDAIRKLLQGARTIAIVGLSAKADRPSNEVAHRLQRVGALGLAEFAR